MTEYQPRHLAPSLDYEAWITDLKADEDADLFPETFTNTSDEPILAAGHGSDAKVLQPGDTMTVTVNDMRGNIATRTFQVRPPRAGHEWTSRSWFA